MASDTNVYAYSGDLVIISYAGVRVKGLADGEFIRIEPVSDLNGETSGTDGGVTVWATNDRRYNVTLVLGQNSPFNPILSARATVQKQTGLPQISTLNVRDISVPGVQSSHSGLAWVKREPNNNYAREIGTREWLLLATLDINLTAGNLLIGTP